MMADLRYWCAILRHAGARAVVVDLLALLAMIAAALGAVVILYAIVAP